MKKKIYVLVLTIFALNLYAQEAPKESKSEFDSISLSQSLVDLEGMQTTIGEVLKKHQGQIVFVDLWASWCSDCIKGLPKLKEVQSQYPDLVYLFLSLDKKEENWKKGIEKYDIKGEHYWFNTEWKNKFTEYIGLNWIPRYMLIDRNGKIAHYYAIHADDPEMMETLVEINLNPKTE